MVVAASRAQGGHSPLFSYSLPSQCGCASRVPTALAIASPCKGISMCHFSCRQSLINTIGSVRSFSPTSMRLGHGGRDTGEDRQNKRSLRYYRELVRVRRQCAKRSRSKRQRDLPLHQRSAKSAGSLGDCWPLAGQTSPSRRGRMSQGQRCSVDATSWIYKRAERTAAFPSASPESEQTAGGPNRTYLSNKFLHCSAVLPRRFAAPLPPSKGSFVHAERRR